MNENKIDINKYQPLDPDIVAISSITILNCIEFKLKNGAEYITFNKSDAIELAKYFKLTEDDLK